MTRSFLPGFEPGTLLKVSERYDGTRVMVVPDPTGYELGTVTSHEVLVSLEYKHGWNKVASSSGTTGWVLVSALEKVT